MAETETKPRLVMIEAENKHLHVFCGVLQEHNCSDRTAVLTDARQCVQWAPSVHGQGGLVTHGPDANCRVTPPVRRVLIMGVVAVYDVTPQAAAAWEAEPWKN